MQQYSKPSTIKFAILFTAFVFSLLCGTMSTFIMKSPKAFGVSLTSAGTLDVYQNISLILGSFVAFSFIFRFGYKKMIISILVLMIILSVITPILSEYWLIKLFLVGTGIVLVGMKVCLYSSSAMVSKDPQQQAGLISLLELLWAISGFFGLWVISFFLSNTHNWLDFLYFYAALAVVNVIIWLFVRIDESVLSKERAKPILVQLKDMFDILKNKQVIAAIVIMFIGSILAMSFLVWLPGFYHEALNISPSLSLQISSVSSVTTFVGIMLAYFLLKYISWDKILFLYFCVGIVFLATVLFSVEKSSHEITNLKDVSIMALALPFFSFFIAPVTPILNSSILSRTVKNKQPTLMSLLTVFFAIAASIAARGIGYLMQYLGGVEGFKVATIIPLILMIILVLPYARFLQKGTVE